MIVDVSSIKDTVLQLENLMKSIPKQVDRINKELQLCDQEISDIMHVIELSNFHASDGYRLAKDIQITRKKRRELKDELVSLLAIQTTSKKHRPTLNQTEAITSTIKQEIGRRKDKKYTPRVRTDFAETFKSLERR